MVGARLLLMLLVVYSSYPALAVGRKVARAAGLGLEGKAADLPDCSLVEPPSFVPPKQHHRVLPGQLSKDWEYDGFSKFLPVETLDVEGTSLKMPLVGRGSADPLRKDPFGAGMRVSTRYAYLGGTLCATIRIPEPTNGTIFGMYLIDYHPKVAERDKAVWREADMEWVGRWPDSFQTVIYEKGKQLQFSDRISPVHHNLTEILNGTVQQDPVRYCIEWDLLGSLSGPEQKTVRLTAESPKHPTRTLIREWSPRKAEADEFWNEPLRGIFTLWSNRNYAAWSGTYSIPAGKMLWVDVQDIEFKPKGPAFCRKADLDL